MRKYTLQLIACLALSCASLYSAATTRVVNNNIIPVAVGQYSTIGTAIAASSDGDTLLVTGSPTLYDAGTILLDRRLVILGAGYNPKGGNSYSSQTNQVLQFNRSASGSVIMGMRFNSWLSSVSGGTPTKYDNITFARNFFNSPTTVGLQFYTSVNDTFTNIKVINNVFNGVPSSADGLGYYLVAGVPGNSPKVWTGEIRNNIFLQRDWGNAGYNAIKLQGNTISAVIDHNLFLWGWYSAPLISSSLDNNCAINISNGNQLITNNIFYNCYPVNGHSHSFYNNITHSGATVPLLPGGYGSSIGTGNINNTNPLMNAIFTSSANPYFDFNLDNVGLQSTSPCINAGSDGTNIGPTGGLYPIYDANSNYLTGEPPVPSVRQLTITGSNTVPSGGTLNVQVTGKKIN